MASKVTTIQGRLPFPPQSVCQDTVETLERLLAAARNGAVVGLAYATFNRGRKHTIGITGEAHSDPVRTLGALERMRYTLNTQLDNKEAR